MCAALFGAVAVSSIDNDTNTHVHNDNSERYSDLFADSDSSVTVKTVTFPTENKHSDVKEAEPAQEEVAQEAEEEQSSTTDHGEAGQAEAAQAEEVQAEAGQGNASADEPASLEEYYCPGCACTQVNQEQYESMYAKLLANGGYEAVNEDGTSYCTLCGAVFCITEPEEAVEEPAQAEEVYDEVANAGDVGSASAMGDTCCPYCDAELPVEYDEDGNVTIQAENGCCPNCGGQLFGYDCSCLTSNSTKKATPYTE